MSVQTLHADACTTNAPARLSALGAHGGEASALGVLFVRRSQRLFVDQLFESVDAPTAFESTDRIVQFWIDEPKQCGHRRAVTQVRFVLDDNRATVESSHYDGASPRKRPTEVLLDHGEVTGQRVAETQRQNSRVRTRRERNAFADEWCFDAVVAFDATNDETDEGETRGCSPGSPIL